MMAYRIAGLWRTIVCPQPQQALSMSESGHSRSDRRSLRVCVHKCMSILIDMSKVAAHLKTQYSISRAGMLSLAGMIQYTLYQCSAGGVLQNTYTKLSTLILC